MNTDHSFWEARWKEKQTGWDLGGPHPALPRLIEKCGARAPGKVWVPGCGRGHDVAAIAQLGFQVLGTDISPTAIVEAKALYGSRPGVQFKQADLFVESPASLFDWIYDRAMLCALSPERQPQYLQVCARNLKERGLFCSILFSSISSEVTEGPPFEVSEGKIPTLFQNWQVVFTELSNPPPLPRVVQQERILVAVRPN
jgi:methyl halide transferase